jgi:hypothetical protein
MDSKVLERLYKLGAIDRLTNGQDGVKVSLMWQTRLSEPSLSARRDLLKQKFECTANDILSDGAEVDLTSISVSGQTVEAVLPIHNFDDITDKLKQQSIRVDPLTRQRVI